MHHLVKGDWMDEDGQIQGTVLLQPHQDVSIDVAVEDRDEIGQGMGASRRVQNGPELEVVAPCKFLLPGLQESMNRGKPLCSRLEVDMSIIAVYALQAASSIVGWEACCDNIPAA